MQPVAEIKQGLGGAKIIQLDKSLLEDADELVPALEDEPGALASEPNLSSTANSPISPIDWDFQNSEDWIRLYRELPLEGMLKSICGQMSFRQRDQDKFIFDIDAAAAGVLSDKYQTKFCEILSEALGQKLELRIECQTNTNESPSTRAARLLREALEAAEAELLDSQPAQKLSEMFDAKLVPGSVSLKQFK